MPVPAVQKGMDNGAMEIMEFREEGAKIWRYATSTAINRINSHFEMEWGLVAGFS